MPVVSVDKLIGLQQSAESIRNICILAHVDHGKTSLTDALIATNGIISPKLAGKIRYLDSRPDEQLRGITMESSAISLYFSLMKRNRAGGNPTLNEHLINLIDSPGHIDFSSEVSTASRLCDGALVLIDAVEGVCSQTVTVLRQTWTEKLKPLLVINKMDRLITELKMTPLEAYTHLSKLLEQVNAVMGGFYQGERMENDLRWRERLDATVAAAAVKLDTHHTTNNEQARRRTSFGEDEGGLLMTDTPTIYEESNDESIYFAPENNNVIFSSAIDGWAFTPGQFASIYEKKIGIKRQILEKVLWGDYYLDPKTKRILGNKHLKGRHLRPLFVQLVLDNIWAVYEATTGGANGKGDSTILEKITKALNITIPPHVSRSKDPRTLLTTVFSSWLPLSTAVLVSVIENLPSPPVAQAARLPALIDLSPGSSHVAADIRSAMCDFRTSSDSPVVVYVSKMVAVPESELPSNKRRGGALTAEEARELGQKKRAEIARIIAAAGDVDHHGIESEIVTVTDALNGIKMQQRKPSESKTDEADKQDREHLIGFARLYSGTLKVGDEIYVIGPKFNPAMAKADPQPKKVKVTALYLLMGRSLESLESVPAGCIVGIGGLEGAVLKSATLCTQVNGAPNLSSTGAISTNVPIVRVALEPAWPGDLGKMVEGLKMLRQADPAVIYEEMSSGEHVIITAGELHLERCLKDLRERFARCDIQAGEFIVPYRESIKKQAEMNPPRDNQLGRGRIDAITASKQMTVRLSVRPLPELLVEFLSKHANTIRRFQHEKKAAENLQKLQGSDVDNNTDEQLSTSNDDDEQVEMEVTDPDPLVDNTDKVTLDVFREEMSSVVAEIKEDRDVWKDLGSKITAFGPKRTGPNLLIDATKQNLFERFLLDNEDPSTQTEASSDLTPKDFLDKIGHAFQLATQQGPLCAEPVQGIAVFIESITMNPSSIAINHNDDESTTAESTSITPQRQHLGRLTGEIIKSVRDSIRTAFLDWSPRILLAMYSCEISASADVLGKVYAVITRRRGRIVSESLIEPSPNFTVVAMLPVAESWGFADEIRKRTSGAASPQLVFEGFEILDEDPFWVPTTEEELEDLGEKGDRENVALRYVEKVRKRKGMFVKRKVVEHGEKQKTLKR